MNLYGLFYDFPGSTFSYSSANGVKPLSSHLSVVNEVFRLFSGKYVLAKNDRVVYGSDPIQSPSDKPSSNIQFVDSLDVANFGKSRGDGGVWVRDSLQAGAVSFPIHIGGYDYITIFLTHSTAGISATFSIEINNGGKLNSGWSEWKTITVGPYETKYIVFKPWEVGYAQWLRARVESVSSSGAIAATVYLRYEPKARWGNYSIFQSLAGVSDSGLLSQGFLDPRDEVLRFKTSGGRCIGVDGASTLGDRGDCASNATNPPTNLVNFGGGYSLEVENHERMVRVKETVGTTARWYRLPKFTKGWNVYDALMNQNKMRWVRQGSGDSRWLNLQGTFYELPLPWKKNDGTLIGGMRKIRPIVTHGRLITD